MRRLVDHLAARLFFWVLIRTRQITPTPSTRRGFLMPRRHP